MNILVAYNGTKGNQLLTRVRLANGIWTRFRGLMLVGQLADGEGLLIDPCTSVHTMFMRIAIDVVFLDRANRVVKIAHDLKPYHFSVAKGSRRVLEISAGRARNLDIEVGDDLRFDPAGLAA